MADPTVVQLQGLDDAIAMLQALPREVVSRVNGPVQKSIRKGLRPMLKRVRDNLVRATSNETTHPDRENTGLLLKQTILSRGRPPSGGNGERYLIRVKKRTYQRATKGQPTTTIQNAQRLEYGTSHQPAEPYIRPAFQAEAANTITTTSQELAAQIDALAQTYLKR